MGLLSNYNATIFTSKGLWFLRCPYINAHIMYCTHAQLGSIRICCCNLFWSGTILENSS